MQTWAYIIAAAASWVVAQGLKYLIVSLKSKGMPNPRQLYLSGGMPSAHSATTTAMVVTLGAFNGVESPVFAVALLLAAIVMYDAVMVRRSSGEQGASLTALITELKSKIRLPRAAKGHTPSEVAVGALVGLIVALVVIFIQNSL
jgi:uncharacterized protein